MAQGELTVALYDFLYQDTARIASYYAQLFRGRLISLEETDSDKTTKVNSGKINAGIANMDMSTSGEVQRTAKRSIDPHDQITIDVLSTLTQGHCQIDPVAARHGELILTSGTLSYFDRTMAEIGAFSLDSLIEAHMKLPKNQRDNDQIQVLKLISQFMTKAAMPSAFLLAVDDDVQIVGTIKDEGLQEPIAAHYYKHGSFGLADVHVIGIKETPTALSVATGQELMGVGQQAAQALSSMMFPDDAIRVTPLAIFRKLW